MPVDTDPGQPEEHTLDSFVRTSESNVYSSSKVDVLKTPRLTRFDIEQIWTLFWWKAAAA